MVQEGTPSELAATPRSAFVADFTGAVVLTGTARPGADGLTHVELDGGGAVVSTDAAEGAVAVSVYPWEIAIEPPDEPPHGSAQNRLGVEVLSITTIGNRVASASRRRSHSRPRSRRPPRATGAARARVVATWKASATRLVGL